jgi:hypothetical protein
MADARKGNLAALTLQSMISAPALAEAYNWKELEPDPGNIQVEIRLQFLIMEALSPRTMLNGPWRRKSTSLDTDYRTQSRYLISNSWLALQYTTLLPKRGVRALSFDFIPSAGTFP